MIKTTSFSEFLKLYHAQKKAKTDNPTAQYDLAELYLSKGQYKEALGWYKKSAKQGYALAQSRLGQMYLEGIYVKKDAQKAVFWYQKAQEQGLDVSPALERAINLLQNN